MAETRRFFLSAVLLAGSLSSQAGTLDPVPKVDSLADIANELNRVGERGGQAGSRPRSDPDGVARGADLFSNNCTQCHRSGAVGAPDWQQRDARGRFPPPPLNGSGHTWHHPQTQLMRIILEGGEGMPGFAGRLDRQDVVDIIQWFQSLWPDRIYAAWSMRNAAAE